MTQESKKRQQKKINFSIRNISQLEFELGASADLPLDGTELFKYNFGLKFILDQNNIGLSIVVMYEFFVNELKAITLQVQTDYAVKELGQIWKDDKVIEKRFITYLVELAIGHARGLQAGLIQQGPLAHFYIPPISKDKILQKLNSVKPD
jgi:hypothetical protein